MMKKSFDSIMTETINKMGTKSDSQKTTNCLYTSDGMENERKMLLNSNIHDVRLLNENLNVNKMLSVLIFLMLK